MHYYKADNATVLGDVAFGEDASVFFGAVIRGDEGPIRIGERSNIQDLVVCHTDPGHDLTIGRDVTVGHGAILHGCTIGDGTVIGMGAIVLNGAVIGSHCLVGAGSLVTEGTVIPDGCLAFGSPAKVIRKLTEKEILGNLENASNYVALAGAELTLCS
jgi:carbonic anhydrase/acetyltransferase-like protein (isoleucine patch superfamily)